MSIRFGVVGQGRLEEHVLSVANLIRSSKYIENLGKNKMNVDDSLLGILGRRGKGGVFRDTEGSVILQLGKEVEVDLVVHAEVLALWEGLFVTATSRWASSHTFMFEFDFVLIVAWVKNHLSAPWSF